MNLKRCWGFRDSSGYISFSFVVIGNAKKDALSPNSYTSYCNSVLMDESRSWFAKTAIVHSCFRWHPSLAECRGYVKSNLKARVKRYECFKSSFDDYIRVAILKTCSRLIILGSFRQKFMPVRNHEIISKLSHDLPATNMINRNHFDMNAYHIALNPNYPVKGLVRLGGWKAL